MGRMKPGVSLAQAQADMEVVTNRIAQDHPQSNQGWGASVEELHNDFFPKEAKQTLWLLMGGVGFILLIACGNVANLVLAKGTTRLKEVAVRTSLGASRWQVFSQFLTESLVLAVLGGALGIGLGWSDHQDHDGEDAAIHASFRSGCDAEYSSAALHSAGHDDRRHVVRMRPCVASLARRSE